MRFNVAIHTSPKPLNLGPGAVPHRSNKESWPCLLARPGMNRIVFAVERAGASNALLKWQRPHAMTRQAAGRGGVAGRGKKGKAALAIVVFDSLCMLRKEVDEGVLMKMKMWMKTSCSVRALTMQIFLGGLVDGCRVP